MNDKGYALIQLAKMGDSRGDMCVIEGCTQVPFSIERVFYDYNNAVGGETRGNHANRNSKFAFICVAGSCQVNVDNGSEKETFILSNPTQMLVVNEMVWKEMLNFSNDSVLLVLSSQKYDKNEYIRDYSEFINEKDRKRNYGDII